MSVEVGVVCKRDYDRDWLLRVRQWVASNDSLLQKIGNKPTVRSLATLENALEWRAQLPAERLLVAIGFRCDDIENGPKVDFGESIVLQGPAASDEGLASVAPNKHTLTTRDDVISQLRKSLIRAALGRSGIQIKLPTTDAEFIGYL